ncbi:class IV adenylate cyclase [Bdellovibrionota bacterium FG-1]
MPNIEIKARCSDLKKARSVALKFKTDNLGVLHQVDTYFITQAGRLKLREINGTTAQLIPYLKDYQTGPMRSDYALLPVEDPNHLKALLGHLLGIEFVVDKRREVFLIENVRVHLDEVKGLGTFVEFEAVCKNDSVEEHSIQTAKVNELMQAFGIRGDDLLDLSYVDYLAPESRRSN